MPKTKIKRYLKNVDVEVLSLVDSAANQRQFIWKSEDPSKQPDFNRQIDIVKTDVEKQLVYGVVYAPDEADAHGDAMTTEEVEKAAHNFLAKARTQNVDNQHNFQADDGHVVESYILAKNDDRFPGEKEGAWAVVIKVTDEDVWEQVKKGELKGISLAGKAQAEEVEKKNSFLQSFFDQFQEFFQKNEGRLSELAVTKDFNQRLNHKQMSQAVWALEEELFSILRDDKQGDKKQSMLGAVDQFKSYLENLNMAQPGSGQNTQKSTTMSGEDPKKETPEETPVEKKAGEAGGGSEEATKEKDPVLKAVEELTETVKGLSERLESVEKRAPARQSGEEERETQDIEKSKGGGPLPIFGNRNKD